MPWGMDPCDPKEGLATLQQQFSMQRALWQEMFHGSAKQDWTKALRTGCSHHLQVPAASANRPFPAPPISGLSKPRTTTERWGSEKAACTTGLVRQSSGGGAKSSESDLQTWHGTQLRVTWPATAWGSSWPRWIRAWDGRRGGSINWSTSSRSNAHWLLPEGEHKLPAQGHFTGIWREWKWILCDNVCCNVY